MVIVLIFCTLIVFLQSDIFYKLKVKEKGKHHRSTDGLSNEYVCVCGGVGGGGGARDGIVCLYMLDCL